MTYNRFEELPARNAAIELAAGAFRLASDRAFLRQRSLRDQLERAAVSVSNSIAEGFERDTTQELLTFLYIARGSAGEVRAMLCLLERMPAFADLKSLAEGISRQLRGWAGALQGGPIKGQRFLTEKTRQVDRARRERDQFLEELCRMQKGA